MAMAAMLAPAFGGTPTVVETVAPVITPAPAAAPTCSVEIGVSNNWAARDILKPGHSGHVDTIGTDITLVHAFNEHHAVDLRFGYAWGHGCAHFNSEDSELRYRSHTFSLMPGYRFTTALTDKVSAFVGANVGVVNSSLKGAAIVSDIARVKGHDSDWGFGYSAEVGLRYALCETMDLFVAYQFSGNTARPKLRDEGAVESAKRQVYHGVRAGVGIKF